MKIKSLVAATAIAVAGITNSFAAVSTLSPSASFSNVVSGAFIDNYSFNLGTASTVATALTNVEVVMGSFSFGKITNFSALLNGLSIFNLSSLSSSTPPVTVTTQILSGSSALPAGVFTLQVSGNAGSGASYGGSIVAAPVPEPETFAMLLAGLGMMGSIAMRRNKKKTS